jgi:hypothetical protein
VADDPATTVIANRREFMDCTLETVEGVARSSRYHFEGKVIIVTAYFTLGHPSLSSTDYADYEDRMILKKSV